METGPIKTQDNSLEWVCLKVSFLIFWISNMGIMLYEVSRHCDFPIGICKWIDFSLLFSPFGKSIIAGTIFILSLFYLLEKWMEKVTLMMFLASFIITSYHESSGIQHHATVFSCLLGVQFLAYLFKRLNASFDLNFNRIHYSVQIIAAFYILAGISKLTVSGLDWINNGNYFAIQVVKNFSFIYFAEGNVEKLNEGFQIGNKLLVNQGWIKLFLSLALLLELGCIVAVLTKKIRIWYGLALMGMHIGIKLIMAIPIGAVAPPMVIYFINPLYWFVKSVKASYLNKKEKTE